MLTPKLTEDIVFDLVNSTDEFAVDFDLAYKWLEFNRKDNAKQSLIGCGFKEGRDFRISLPNQGNTTMDLNQSSKSSKAGRKSEKIWLTTECFKSWGMMAATQKGKEVREYFLGCERKMKQLAANPVRTDWVLSDLFENDVLASAVAALSQLFLGKAKEQKQGKNNNPNDIDYADIANALWFAAMEIQTDSPEFDEEADVFPPEVQLDHLRWCSMLRDAFVMLSPSEAAKFMTEAAEKNPGAGYFHSFPTSVAIPGYQRVDDEALAIKKQVVSAASNQQRKNIQQQKKIAISQN